MSDEMPAISDKAVEAAAFALYWGLRETWEREPEADREEYRRDAHRALEAALPHLDSHAHRMLALDRMQLREKAQMVDRVERLAEQWQNSSEEVSEWDPLEELRAATAGECGYGRCYCGGCVL